MKSFLKNVLSTIIGMLLAVFVIILLFRLMMTYLYILKGYRLSAADPRVKAKLQTLSPKP